MNVVDSIENMVFRITNHTYSSEDTIIFYLEPLWLVSYILNNGGLQLYGMLERYTWEDNIYLSSQGYYSNVSTFEDKDQTGNRLQQMTSPLQEINLKPTHLGLFGTTDEFNQNYQQQRKNIYSGYFQKYEFSDGHIDSLRYSIQQYYANKIESHILGIYSILDPNPENPIPPEYNITLPNYAFLRTYGIRHPRMMYGDTCYFMIRSPDGQTIKYPYFFENHSIYPTTFCVVVNIATDIFEPRVTINIKNHLELGTIIIKYPNFPFTASTTGALLFASNTDYLNNMIPNIVIPTLSGAAKGGEAGMIAGLAKGTLGSYSKLLMKNHDILMYSAPFSFGNQVSQDPLIFALLEQSDLNLETYIVTPNLDIGESMGNYYDTYGVKVNKNYPFNQPFVMNYKDKDYIQGDLYPITPLSKQATAGINQELQNGVFFTNG
jgi:hypothetical protein